MRKLHLALVSLVGVALIGTACATTAPATTVSKAQPAATSSTPVAKAQPSAPSPTPESKPQPAVTERVVKHAMGETKVPANPQRVVVLDTGELDMALALGIKPVGAVAYTLDQEFPSQLRARTADIKRVGTVAQPNLEAIAALKPDLILSSKLRHEAIYDKLAKIAPTVFSENLGVAWKDAFKVHAAALGKTTEADEFMSNYYRRLEGFKKKMGEPLGKTRVSFIRSFPDHMRIYMNRSFSGTILKDAGLPRPAVQDQDKVYDQVTEERIPDMDGDVIFTGYYERAKGETLSRMAKHPLWAQLKAVKANKVYEVDDDVWGVGLGPLAANLIVDDLFKYLAGSSSVSTAAKTERVVRHAMGETKVPGSQQRVVVLDNGALDNVLALGVKPIGAPTVFADDPYPSYLKEQAQGIDNIGTINEPNLERVARLKPDLILGSKDTQEKIYDKLSRIAPTVLIESLGATWKGNIGIQAEALGKTEEATRLLRDYDKRLAELRAKMGEQLAKTRVSLLRPMPDHVRLYLKKSFSGSVIEDAGLPRPSTQNKDEFSAKATLEQIPDMDGEVIFWFGRDPDFLLKKVMSNPLWTELQAVKTNRVHQVDPETWLSGLGVQAANIVLDDLFKYLVK